MEDLSKLREHFTDEDIEWKIQTAGKQKDGKPWALVVPYVQARAIAQRLDDVAGPLNWRVEYVFQNNDAGSKLDSGIICRLSLREDGSQFWVTKEDGAEQSDIESFKGGLSNAFKRAAVVWGMGRELYALDNVYADICEKNSTGSRYGKTKDGDVFYWRAPKIGGGKNPPDTDKGGPVSSGAGAYPIKPKERAPQAEGIKSESKLSPIKTWKPGELELARVKELLAHKDRPNPWSGHQYAHYIKYQFNTEKLSDLNRLQYEQLIQALTLGTAPLIHDGGTK